MESQKSFVLGDGEGLFQVAEFYHLGFYVMKNRKKEFEYFLKSVETNYDMGIWKTTLCYHFGYGININYD
ncbi:14090_t:CDS:2 [Dentiscutata erythropus]|uniref:14090_t:CDS:1 n=1 Tax=Dentiscutata erythropus TaxID=1348616 RepID=A0A9N9FD34_9GLOM|nr:14090_t:CDS:2 [Dentiscutata erythropus]